MALQYHESPFHVTHDKEIASKLAVVAGNEGINVKSLKRGLKTVMVNGKTLFRHLKDGLLAYDEIVEICNVVVNEVELRTVPNRAEQERNRGMVHNYIIGRPY